MCVWFMEESLEIMDRTGGSLCYSPGRVCKLVLSTMILHNLCIQHGLQLEQELLIEIEEDPEIVPHDSTTSGQALR